MMRKTERVCGLIYLLSSEKSLFFFFFPFVLCWCDDSVAYAHCNKLLRSKDGAVCLVTFKLWMPNREMQPCSKSSEESVPCCHRCHCALINISDVSWTHLTLGLWTINLFLSINDKAFNHLLALPLSGLQEVAEERGEADPHDVLRSLWVLSSSLAQHAAIRRDEKRLDEIRLCLTLNGEIYK